MASLGLPRGAAGSSCLTERGTSLAPILGENFNFNPIPAGGLVVDVVVVLRDWYRKGCQESSSSIDSSFHHIMDNTISPNPLMLCSYTSWS